MEALNYLAGKRSFNTEFNFSAGQSRALEHLDYVVGSVEAPECSPSEAYESLCKARAGYQQLPADRARYQRELVSLPDRGGLVDGTTCLDGDALDYWNRWQERILLPPGDDSEVRQPVPYSDPSLVKAPREYAWFIASLASRGLLRIGARASATLGTQRSAAAASLRHPHGVGVPLVPAGGPKQASGP